MCRWRSKGKRCRESPGHIYIKKKKKEKNLALQLWGPASLTSVGQAAGWKPSGRSKVAVLKQNAFFLTELSGLKALQLIG